MIKLYNIYSNSCSRKHLLALLFCFFSFHSSYAAYILHVYASGTEVASATFVDDPDSNVADEMNALFSIPGYSGSTAAYTFKVQNDALSPDPKAVVTPLSDYLSSCSSGEF